MHAIYSLGLGYLIGSISPAALLGKIKHVDLKQEGTKNLGATNTTILLGRASGIFVMIFDILKSFFSAKIARWLFPQLVIAGMLACIGAIVGHCFPIFLHFEGGKGLAAFGGMVLAYKPWFFVAIVIPAVLLMLILDTGVAVPMLASIMFPLLTFFHSRSFAETACAAVASGFIVFMHRDNLKKAKSHSDFMNVKVFLNKILFKKK